MKVGGVVYGLVGLIGAVGTGSFADAALSPDYQQAYVYALRCFVVVGAANDQAGARKAFDAAMKLGQLQNLSNRQLNADLDHWTATELVKTVRDPAYKATMLTTCKKLGMAS